MCPDPRLPQPAVPPSEITSHSARPLLPHCPALEGPAPVQPRLLGEGRHGPRDPCRGAEPLGLHQGQGQAARPGDQPSSGGGPQLLRCLEEPHILRNPVWVQGCLLCSRCTPAEPVTHLVTRSSWVSPCLHWKFMKDKGSLMTHLVGSRWWHWWWPGSLVRRPGEAAWAGRAHLAQRPVLLPFAELQEVLAPPGPLHQQVRAVHPQVHHLQRPRGRRLPAEALGRAPVSVQRPSGRHRAGCRGCAPPRRVAARNRYCPQGQQGGSGQASQPQTHRCPELLLATPCPCTTQLPTPGVGPAPPHHLRPCPHSPPVPSPATCPSTAAI